MSLVIDNLIEKQRLLTRCINVVMAKWRASTVIDIDLKKEPRAILFGLAGGYLPDKRFRVSLCGFVGQLPRPKDRSL